MSHSVRVPSEEEQHSPKTDPCAPCTAPCAAPCDAPCDAPCTLLGPCCKTMDHLHQCNTHGCCWGRSSNTLLKGCKRKRPQNTADTENEQFSHKCSELQCYLPPLSAILRGLKSGRYSDRLSSFQESLAMDRIQRILGALQSPAPGGRFLSTVLKIEEMLHSWFPHIKDARVCKRHKLCPNGPEWLYSSHDALLHWSHPPPVDPAPSVTQDNAVSSSSDVRTPPPADNSPPQPPRFIVRSPCLERLLKAEGSLIQTRTEARPDGNPD